MSKAPLASIEALPLLASELTVKVREVSPSIVSVKVSVPVIEPASSAPVPDVSPEKAPASFAGVNREGDDLCFLMAVVIGNCDSKGIGAVEVCRRCVRPGNQVLASMDALPLAAAAVTV